MLVRLAGSARKFSLAHVAENELGGFDLVQLKTIAYLSGALACTLTGAGISTLILFDARTSKSIKESEARTSASIKELEARTSASINEVKESIKESEARTSASIKEVKESIKEVKESIKESEARTAASIKEVKELIKESLGARGKGVESSSKRSGWWSG